MKCIWNMEYDIWNMEYDMYTEICNVEYILFLIFFFVNMGAARRG
jgi:hypothetical protein